MTANGWIQIGIFFICILAAAKPLGLFIAAVMEGRRNWLSPVLAPVERVIYRISGIQADKEQTWPLYAISLLAFSLVSGLLLYAMQRLQGFLPLNVLGLKWNVSPDLAFNTAFSFTTNT